MKKLTITCFLFFIVFINIFGAGAGEVTADVSIYSAESESFYTNNDGSKTFFDNKLVFSFDISDGKGHAFEMYYGEIKQSNRILTIKDTKDKKDDTTFGPYERDVTTSVTIIHYVWKGIFKQWVESERKVWSLIKDNTAPVITTHPDNIPGTVYSSATRINLHRHKQDGSGGGSINYIFTASDSGAGIKYDSLTIKSNEILQDGLFSINSDGVYNIEVSIEDRLGNSSSTSFTIIRDISAPTIAISQTESQLNGTRTFTATPSDGTSGIAPDTLRWLRPSNSTWVIGSAVSILEGETTQFKVKDRAGNWGYSALLSVPTVLPTLTALPSTTEPTNQGVGFTIIADDTGISGIQPGSFKYRFITEEDENPDWVSRILQTNSESPIATDYKTELEAGLFSQNGIVEFYVSDKAGNEKTITYTIHNFDNTPPHISTETDIEDSVWFSTAKTYSIAGTDNLTLPGELDYEVQLSRSLGSFGSTVVSWYAPEETSSFTFDETSLSEDGPYGALRGQRFAIRSKITDQAGNTTTSETIKVGYDPFSPVVNAASIISQGRTIPFDNSINRYVVNDTPQFRLRISDAESGIDWNGVRVKLDTEAYKPIPPVGSGSERTFELSDELSDGRHTVTFQVSDIAGNDVTVVFEIFVVSTGPSIVGGGSLNPTPTSGELLFRYQDLDIEPLPIIVDSKHSTVPIPSILDLQYRIVNEAGTEIRGWQAVPSSSSFSYDLAGVIADYGEGFYEFEVRAADILGNFGEAYAYTFELDKTPPDINVNFQYFTNGIWKPYTGNWINGPVRLQITSPDPNADFDVSFSEEAYSFEATKIGAGIQIEVVPDDPNSAVLLNKEIDIAIFANDPAGNPSESVTKTLRFDTLAPAFGETWGGIKNSAFYRDNISLSGTVVDETSVHSGIQNVYYRLGYTGPWHNLSYSAVNNKITGVIDLSAALEGGELRVFVKAIDNAGNTAVNEWTVYRDSTAPAISFELKKPDSLPSDTTVGSDFHIGIQVDPNNSSGVNNSPLTQVFYIINNGNTEEEVAFSQAELVNGRTTIFSENLSLSEGEMIVSVTARDDAGNQSTIQLPTLWVDLIPPDVTDGKIHIIGEPEESTEELFYVSDIVANVMAEGIVDDSVLSFSWLITETPFYADDSPGWSALSDLRPYEVSVTNSGTYYLHTKPVDSAGNVGAVVSRVIRFDNGVPAAPIIRSTSHKRAVSIQDAVSDPNLVIRFGSGTSSSSGIAGYRYELRHGISLEQSTAIQLNGFSGMTTSERLYFTELEDNKEAEYYFLRAWAIAGNGKESTEPAIYRFRIDTSPPTDLRVYSSNYANSELVYSYPKASYYWRKPLDLTGIKSYEYIIEYRSFDEYLSGDDSILYDAEGEEKNIPSNQWRSTSVHQDGNGGLEVELVPWLSSQGITEKAGLLICAVSARDWAGNRMTDEMVIQFDIEAPHVPESVTTTSNPELRTVLVEWEGSFSDNSEGFSVDSRLGIIHEGEYKAISSWASVDHTKKRQVFGGLEPDQGYFVTLRIRDASEPGNVSQKTVWAYLGENPPQEEPPIYYDYDLYGYPVRAEVYASLPEKNVGYLEFTPELARVERLDPETSAYQAITGIEVNDLLVDGNVITSATSDQGQYRITSGGLTFTAHSFSIIEGIITAEDVGIGLPGTDQVEGNFPSLYLSNNLNEQVSAPSTSSLIQPTVVQTENSSGELSWSLEEVHAVGIKNGELYIPQAKVNVSEQSDIHLVAYNGQDSLSDLTVGPINLGFDGKFKSAALGLEESELLVLLEENAIVSDGVRLSVEAANLLDDRIGIHKAELQFGPQISPRSMADPQEEIQVYLYNLYLLNDGSMEKPVGFSMTPFQLPGPVPGSWVEVDSLDVVEGSLFIDGAVLLADGTRYTVQDVKYTGDGIAEDASGDVDNMSIEVGQFTINSELIKLTHEGFLVVRGTIPITQIIADQSIEIENILLSYDLSEVLEAGTGESQFRYGLSGYDESGTKSVAIQAYELNSTGIIVTNGYLSLPSGISGDDIALGDSRMNPLGQLTHPGITIPNLEIEGFEVTVDTVELAPLGMSTTTVYLHQIEVMPGRSGLVMPVGYNSARMSVSQGLKLETNGISIRARIHGWSIVMNDPTFYPGQGFGGSGVLSLPSGLGGRGLAFEQVTISSEGEFITQIAPVGTSGLLLIRQGLWRVDQHSLDSNGNLLIPKLTYMLPSGVSSSDIWIKDVSFTSSGQLLESGAAIREYEVLGINGVRARLVGGRLSNRGTLLAKGNLWLPQSLGGATLPTENFDIELSPEGYVTSDAFAVNENYVLSGLAASSETVWATREGLMLNQNKVQIGTAVFPVPEFLAFGSGTLQPVGAKTKIEQAINLFGFTVRADAISVGDHGIQADLAVFLPQSMGGVRLYFEDTSIWSESGTIRIRSDVLIPKVRFTIGPVSVELTGIRFGERGFSIGRGRFFLPDDLENSEIIIENFVINADGSLTIGNANIPDFSLFGLDIGLNQISFSDNRLNIGGEVSFGPDFVIPSLRGNRVDIDQFRYDFETNELDFSVGIDELSVDLGDGWVLEGSEIVVEESGLKIGIGQLRFPQQWLPFLSVEEVGVGNVSVDFDTGEFAFGSIFAHGVEVTIEDYSFSIHSLEYSTNDGFIISGEVPIPGIFEGETEPTLFTVHRLQITPDFTIGDIDAEVSVTNVQFADNVHYTGSLRITKASKVQIIASGLFTLGPDFSITELRGTQVGIEEFVFDFSEGKITSLSAILQKNPEEITTVLGLPIKGLGIGISAAAGSPLEVYASGAAILPSDFPGFGSEELGLTLRITGDGQVKELVASVTTTKDRSIDGDLVLQAGAKLSASAVTDDQNKLIGLAFTLEKAKMVFGPEFEVENLRGHSITVNSFGFSTAGTITALDLVYAAPERFELFESTYLVNGQIQFSKTSDGRGVELGITGDLELPDSLGNMRISVRDFKIDSSGNITIDASANIASAILFEAVEVVDARLSVKTGAGAGELLFNLTGSLKLPDEAAPEELKGTQFTIFDFAYSTRHGIQTFQAGLSGETIEFEIINGVEARLESFSIGVDGFGTQIDLAFKQGFQGLKNEIVVSGRFFLTWDGEFSELDARLAKANFDLFGLPIGIENLVVSESGITLEKATILLPKELNNQEIAIVNAGIDWNGNLYGDIAVETLTIIVSGLEVVFSIPDINFDTGVISFDYVAAKLPAALGGISFELKDTTISSRGIEVEGGGFEVPDFTASGVGFSDVYVGFYKESGAYVVEGGAKAFIPGVGELGAQLSITEISETYPIGVKYAVFSFKTAGLGLPLGPTGVYINGIKGSLAFGPPGKEMDPYLRDKFGSGFRVGLEVYLQDQTQKIQGSAGFWVNLVNWDFAVFGTLEILDGLIRSKVIASVTQAYGFEARFDISLEVVQGKAGIYGGARIHIWEENGTKLCGEAWVGLLIRKGAIQIFGINLPGKDTTFGPLGIEFGDFKNDIQGFKGYIDLGGIVGVVGFFIGDDFAIGDVSEYVLLDKSASYSGPKMSSWDRMRSFIAGSGEPRAALARPSTSSRVTILDGNMSTTREYDFISPESAPLSGKAPTIRGSVARGSDQEPRSTTSGGDQSYDAQGRDERIIFVVNHTQGNPGLNATSPDGRVFTLETPGVITERDDGYTAMAVLNPTPGTWNLQVTGLTPGDAYDVSIYGKRRIPEISVNTPAQMQQWVSGVTLIEGDVSAAVDPSHPATVTIYIANEPGSFVGRSVGSLTPDDSGHFVYELDTSVLEEGEYYIYASIDDGHNPSVKAFAEGSIIVSHDDGQPIPSVENLTVTTRDDGSIWLAYDAPPTARITGFNLYVQENGGEVTKRNLGYIRTTDISWLTDGVENKLWVRSYDSQGRESAPSSEVEVNFDDPALEIDTDLQVIDSDLKDLQFPTGQGVTISVPYVATNWKVYGDGRDYYKLEDIDAPEGMLIIPGQQRWVVEPQGQFDINIVTDLSGGTDVTITLIFVNLGDSSIQKSVTLTGTVEHPAPRIRALAPETWNNKNSQELELKVDAWHDGLSVYLDETELTVREVKDEYVFVSVPANVPDGNHVVRMVDEHERSSEYDVTIIKPEYRTLVYKNHTTAMAGGQAIYYLGTRGIHEFEGSGTFSLHSQPTGWSGNSVVIPAGDTFATAFSVAVPTGVLPGTYQVQIINDQLDVIPLTVLVLDETGTPHISSLSHATAFQGEVIEIYGYDFLTEQQDTPQVLLGGAEAQIIHAESDRLRVRIPSDATSGTISVVSAGQMSNEMAFGVHETGLELSLSHTQIALESGESGQVNLIIGGYDPEVRLTTELDGSPLIQTAIEQTVVVPNASTVLTITALPEIDQGSQIVTIIAQGQYATVEKQVLVTIGDPLKLSHSRLPDGFVGSPYEARIRAEHGTQPMVFKAASRHVPPGLQIRDDGSVVGIPSKPGTYSIDLSITDASGKTGHGTILLLITEPLWQTGVGTGGQTRYLPTELPSEGRVLWKTGNPRNVEVSELLTGPHNVLSWTDGVLTAFDRFTGVERYSLSPVDKLIAVSGRYFTTLSENGEMKIYDEFDGKLVETVDSVRQILPSPEGLLFVHTSGETAVYNSEEGLMPLPIRVPDSVTLLHHASDFIAVDEHVVYQFDAGVDTWRVLYQTVDEITTASFDEYGLTLGLENGVVVGQQQQAFKEILRLPYAIQAVVSNPWTIVATDGTTTKSVDRETVETLFENFGGGEFFAGNEQMVQLENGNAVLRNLYRGTEVWTKSEQPIHDVALAGQRIYLLDNEGRIYSIGGEWNTTPPESWLEFSPEEPNGDNAYYVSEPHVRLRAVDLESTVSSRKWLITNIDQAEDDSVLQEYEGPQTLSQGIYQIRYQSTDNHGAEENLKTELVYVDTQLPTSNYGIDGQLGDNGYYLDTASLFFEGYDSFSGIDRIEYRIDEGEWNRYSNPIMLPGDKTYHIQWNAIDVAGNVEGTREIDISVDTENPIATHQLNQEDGFTIIYINGSDAISGVADIYYKLDKGEYAEYTSPILVTRPGRHVVHYYVTDQSGRRSEEYSDTFRTSGKKNGNVISRVYWNERLPYDGVIRSNVMEGLPAYHDVPITQGAGILQNLPSWLIGSDMLVTGVEDGKRTGDPWVTVQLKKHAFIYLLTPPGVSPLLQKENDLQNWELISHGEQSYVSGAPDGWSIYRKQEIASGRVAITLNTPIGTTWPTPLLIAQDAKMPWVKIQYPWDDWFVTPDRLVQPTGFTQKWWSLRHTPTRIEWDYSIDAGETWVLIQDGEFTTPYTQSGYELHLRLSVYNNADGGLLGRDIRTYTVENPARIQWVTPQAGSGLVYGSSHWFGLGAIGIERQPISGATIRIETRVDDGVWEPLEYSRYGFITVPEYGSNWEFRATWDEGHGRDHQETWSYSLTEAKKWGWWQDRDSNQRNNNRGRR